MFSLICAWPNGWVNNWDAGDLRRRRAYHNVTVMPDNICRESSYYSASDLVKSPLDWQCFCTYWSFRLAIHQKLSAWLNFNSPLSIHIDSSTTWFCQCMYDTGTYNYDKTFNSLAYLLLWHREVRMEYNHDDVIIWKKFPRYWPFVRGIHRSPVNSPYNDQWRTALIFSLIYTWINGLVNSVRLMIGDTIALIMTSP